MTVREFAETIGAELIQDAFDDRDIASVYTSDLLSDVMAHGHECDVLVTIQSHKNTVAVASLIGAAAILVAGARPVPNDMVEAAREEGIAIVRSTAHQFELSGRLWAAMHASAGNG